MEKVSPDAPIFRFSTFEFDARAGEPGIGADVRLTESVGMMQAAENGELVAMRQERSWRWFRLALARLNSCVFPIAAVWVGRLLV